MQKAAGGVKREAPTDELLDSCLRFAISRGHVDDKAVTFTIDNVL